MVMHVSGITGLELGKELDFVFPKNYITVANVLKLNIYSFLYGASYQIDHFL